MKNHIKIIIISILILFLFGITEVNAASASISASSTNATVGDSVIITVQINAAAWDVSVSGGGISDKIVGYNEDAVNETKTKTYSLNTTQAGTYTVSISGNVTDENDSKAYPTQSVNITVNNPAPTPDPTPKPTPTPSKPSNNTTTTKSDNSKLSRLEIAEGVMTPFFDTGITEYSINVPNEITKLSISAIADSSKATVEILGNDELQVGDNNIEVIVTAEDGSKTTYKILANRAPLALGLQSLTAYYLDENNEQQQLILTPEFKFDIFEYKVEEQIPHTINNIIIEGIANRENATIEILGNEELSSGENIITIKITSIDEAGLEEQKIYTISIEKEEEPVVVPATIFNKVQNWFSGVGTTVSKWLTDNFNKIITGMLIVATVAVIGLTIYFAYDYKNYQKILMKLAELNKTSLMERANVALDPTLANDETLEAIEPVDNNETVEAAEPVDNNEKNKQDILEEFIKNNESEAVKEKKVKKVKGKRFK